MKHFLLSILVIAVLVVFGTCFILAAQAVLTLFKAQSTEVQRMIEAGNCTLQGTVLLCKGF